MIVARENVDDSMKGLSSEIYKIGQFFESYIPFISTKFGSARETTGSEKNAETVVQTNRANINVVYVIVAIQYTR